ncbi:hypothetical protein K438DRAFT_1924998 [Mycena galopus ATCC 62051]|nr:hypothetical protein K438DRAFT_1924998 [Mycena galopus ATCC 62051]
MHRALQILEIIEAICYNLYTAPLGYGLQPDRIALFTLARTCKLFSSPALDALWRTQTGFGPFLRLMPSDLFVLLARDRIWRMLRPIIATDWNRPLVYAPRVKILSLKFDTEEVVEILPALSLSCPGGILFPNLREFTWLAWSRGFIPFRLFFPSTLKKITLNCEASTTNFSLLSILAASCPRLTHVSVAFETRSEFESASSLFVCGLHHLQSLSFRQPTIAALQHIAQLPTLTSLKVTKIPIGFGLTSNKDTPIFPRLRRLVIGQIDVERAAKFLSFFSHSPLVSLQIDLPTFVPSAATNSLFQTVQTACSHGSLDSFVLRNFDNPTVYQESHIIRGRSIETLTCFANITTLSIRSPVGFDLDDATVARLAAAWPHLRSLTLETSLDNVHPQTTLDSLHALARHCPQLVSVTIELNATSVPSLNGPLRLVHTRLYVLGVGGSPISSPAPVARYLSSLFPALEYIFTIREEENNDDLEANAAVALHRIWKQVEEQIPEFVAARREEHLWAKSSEDGTSGYPLVVADSL